MGRGEGGSGGLCCLRFGWLPGVAGRFPPRSSPAARSFVALPKVSFRIGFRYSKVWEGPAPGVHGVRRLEGRSGNPPTEVFFFLVAPATRPRGHLLRCVAGEGKWNQT